MSDTKKAKIVKPVQSVRDMPLIQPDEEPDELNHWTLVAIGVAIIAFGFLVVGSLIFSLYMTYVFLFGGA